jgi:predicted membrane channel-forming protein YqfA (hemolysin III family)
MARRLMIPKERKNRYIAAHLLAAVVMLIGAIVAVVSTTRSGPSHTESGFGLFLVGLAVLIMVVNYFVNLKRVPDAATPGEQS